MTGEDTKEQLNLHLYHEPTDRILAKEIFEYIFPNYRMEENPAEKEIDMLFYPRNQEFGHELGGLDVEKQTLFQYGVYLTKRNAVSIPERKRKFFLKHKDSYWLCLSWYYTHYILLTGTEVLRGNKRPSIYTYMGDKNDFIDVPLNEVKIFPIPNEILHNGRVIRAIKRVFKIEERNLEKPEYYKLKEQLIKCEKKFKQKIDQIDLFS
jgi:hypothetical protein